MSSPVTGQVNRSLSDIIGPYRLPDGLSQRAPFARRLAAVADALFAAEARQQFTHLPGSGLPVMLSYLRVMNR